MNDETYANETYGDNDAGVESEQTEINVNSTRPPKSDLAELIDLRKPIQKSRIAFGNRVSAIDRKVDTQAQSNRSLYERYFERLHALEKEIDADIAAEVEALDTPIFQAMLRIKGAGPVMAAKVLTPIDIRKSKSVSALWKYSGYGTTNGKRDRPIKGQKLSYNKTLKIAVRLLVLSFLKSHSPYADLYAVEKQRRLNMTNPETGKFYTKNHSHNIAIGKVAKIFLSHLWATWRTLEGLETKYPYVFEKLGHDVNHYLRPEEFGWSLDSDNADSNGKGKNGKRRSSK